MSLCVYVYVCFWVCVCAWVVVFWSLRLCTCCSLYLEHPSPHSPMASSHPSVCKNIFSAPPPSLYPSYCVLVSISSGCCNKLPKTGLFETTEIYSHSSWVLKSEIKVLAATRSPLALGESPSFPLPPSHSSRLSLACGCSTAISASAWPSLSPKCPSVFLSKDVIIGFRAHLGNPG